MTTKQMLLSALILSATGNIALGMDNPYNYPQIPTTLCDICELDQQTYVNQYAEAISRELAAQGANGNFTANDTLNSVKKYQESFYPLQYKADVNYQTLMYYKQLICPEYMAAKRAKQSEAFANLICQLNHEQQ